MAADRAIAFARDLLAAGQRVIGMESSDGKTLNELEVGELCAIRDRLGSVTVGGTFK